jgi:hypothetical protein
MIRSKRFTALYMMILLLNHRRGNLRQLFMIFCTKLVVIYSIINPLTLFIHIISFTKLQCIALATFQIQTRLASAAGIDSPLLSINADLSLSLSPIEGKLNTYIKTCKARAKAISKDVTAEKVRQPR